MYYENYNIQRSESFLKISVDKLIEFEHNDNEQILQGTPKWWDEYIIEKIDFHKYDIYFLCFCTVFRGCYNAVTDYKKIWGLKNLEKGFYDNQYLNKNGRVYFGVIKGNGEKSFRSTMASTILFLPRKEKFEEERVFEILARNKFDFFTNEELNAQTLKEIRQLFEGSILLKYNCINEVSLTIWGADTEGWFGKECLYLLGGKCDTIYRNY